jgi:hypothetical protein
MHDYYHHFNNSVNNSSNFWGSFLGAFFAFIFGLIAYRITKKWERFVQHKNSLVKLDRILNKHLDHLEILKVLANDSLNILNAGKLTPNRLYEIKIPENLDMELGSIDIVNKLFSYQLCIDKLNINTLHTNNALNRIEEVAVTGQKPHSDNIDFIRKMFTGILADLTPLQDLTRDLLIVVRINYKKIEKETFLYGILKNHWDFEITEAEIKIENDLLKKEIEIVKDKTVKGKL